MNDIQKNFTDAISSPLPFSSKWNYEERPYTLFSKVKDQKAFLGRIRTIEGVEMVIEFRLPDKISYLYVGADSEGFTCATETPKGYSRTSNRIPMCEAFSIIDALRKFRLAKKDLCDVFREHSHSLYPSFSEFIRMDQTDKYWVVMLDIYYLEKSKYEDYRNREDWVDWTPEKEQEAFEKYDHTRDILLNRLTRDEFEERKPKEKIPMISKLLSQIPDKEILKSLNELHREWYESQPDEIKELYNRLMESTD